MGDSIEEGDCVITEKAKLRSDPSKAFHYAVSGNYEMKRSDLGRIVPGETPGGECPEPEYKGPSPSGPNLGLSTCTVHGYAAL